MRPVALTPVALTLALLCTAQAASPVIITPASGTPLRKAILNSLRVPVMRHLGLKLLSFKVSHLLVSGQWAFVQARPLDAAYNAVVDPLTNAPEVWALLQKTPAGWQVRRWAMPTDVVSEGWEAAFPNVPKKLWPHYRW
ncbi:hypothetical protein WDJ50_03045 [Deinococcus sp. VB142]|uniref:Uncharacterized protein n=1 Tax=Deinococcus sp. VB142 TaxID=3112952 RepID=A0AAU6Q4L6_9DEIO